MNVFEARDILGADGVNETCAAGNRGEIFAWHSGDAMIPMRPGAQDLPDFRQSGRHAFFSWIKADADDVRRLIS